MKQKLTVIGIALLAIGGVIALQSSQVAATTVTIDINLSVTPNVISFETVFPGEVLFRPFNIGLSQAFLDSPIHDDVEYRILQRPKPRIDSDEERAYCQQNPLDYTRCYPTLCPYLSKEPDNTPENDTGVPAYHDPNDPTSIAYGRIAKSDNDLEDNWIIDLHTPCFRGQCDQTNSVAPEYQLDPALEHETFGCDLIVEVTEVSYRTVTRTPGYWQTHTTFTSNMFQTYFGGTMTVGNASHLRTITNQSSNAKSILFGSWYSSIPKKTNGSNRAALDKARMGLLQQLVSTKLNCAIFLCPPDIEAMMTTADNAYANGTVSQITALTGELSTYNNSGEGIPIPPSFGDPGGATPATSQAKANKVFWDAP